MLRRSIFIKSFMKIFVNKYSYLTTTIFFKEIITNNNISFFIHSFNLVILFSSSKLFDSVVCKDNIFWQNTSQISSIIKKIYRFFRKNSFCNIKTFSFTITFDNRFNLVCGISSFIPFTGRLYWLFFFLFHLVTYSKFKHTISFHIR